MIPIISILIIREINENMLQADRSDTTASVPDYHHKVSVPIKQVVILLLVESLASNL